MAIHRVETYENGVLINVQQMEIPDPPVTEDPVAELKSKANRNEGRIAELERRLSAIERRPV